MRNGVRRSNAAIALISLLFLSMAGLANIAMAEMTTNPNAQIEQPVLKASDGSRWTTLSRRYPPATPPSFRDQRAALEAIHFALREVADGSVFVWRRQKGILSGLVKPTSSFRDQKGAICRHLEFSMSFGDITRKIESIACRQNDGSWTLSG